MHYQDDMSALFDRLETLSELQRTSLKERYRFMMNEYRFRCRFYTFLFYTLRITMTVGSLAVPALLSIQPTTTATDSTGHAVYWFTWALSLAVTTANGITTLFKLDKRFFMLHATAERLRTETWQYIQLSGRYSGHHGHPHTTPTHENQYVYYCSQLEKINMKRVDEEFIKNADMEDPTLTHPGQTPVALAAAAAAAASGSKIVLPPSTSVLVPSPLDQATNRTPLLLRRDSSSSVESDDVGIDVDDTETTTVSVRPGERGERGPLFRIRGAEQPLLRAPQVDVPPVTVIGMGTEVSTTGIQ